MKKLLLSLAAIGILASFCTQRSGDVDDELMTLAKELQQRCSTDRVCPESLEGWEKSSGGSLRKGNFRYHTSDTNQAFDLYYHYGPDWDVWVEGGVDKPLKKR